MKRLTFMFLLTLPYVSACGLGNSPVPEAGRSPDAAVEISAEATFTSGGAGGAAAEIAGEWRCKAQDNIPIGLLNVAPSGHYKFTVVRNSLWEPKPGDSGNGEGTLEPSEGIMRPVDGPLVDAYEILGIARVESEWGVRIFLNNDFGTLLHCGLASEEG